ncbi:MAG: hypothetical protein R3D70_05830 [Rhizobiaceae bacterium]
MMPILAFANLLENGSVVASSEDADFPVENAFDWRTSDWFKPATSGTVNIDLTLSGSESADYFAFYGHDLYAHSGTIKLQWWDGGGWVDCFAAVTPDDNSPRVITFNAQTSDKWRVVITCTGVFSIAVLSFGEALAVERGMYMGWTPPKYGRETEIIDSTSDGGEFLGRSIIAHGVKTTLEINKASEAWMEANWLGFVTVAEARPFFFLPDKARRPDDAVFAFTDGAIPTPTVTAVGFMSVSIPIRGMVE